ncbi:MAG: hypothetical protein GTN73_00730 [Candidatus Aminicenantes bacterium]|nr:hypothetical protein [Candidatus Aminicenantes bacterium]
MKNKKALIIMIFICFFSGTWVQSKSQAVTQENAKQKKLENFLRTAKIVSKRRAGGRGENWIISLDDGKISRYGFFKLLDATRPDALIPDSYKYGIAAYELDKLLDLNLIPPVVEREIEGRKGSLQIFIEGALNESVRRMKNIKPPDPEKFKNTMEDLSVFENLTYSPSFCGERELDDILIMHKKDWKVWRVDFSEAFAPSPELIPECEITGCSKKLCQNLIKLEDEKIKAKLEHYLNDEEMSMLLKRKELIIEKIKKLIEKKAEESILSS